MKHYFLISLLLVIVCIPKLTEAASVSFVVDNSVVYVGDTVVVNVFLDTKGETINAIDGNLSFSDFTVASIREISLANSTFTLWPSKPSLSLTDGSISFVGGIPNGIQSSQVLLFKIIVELKQEGVLSFKNNAVEVFSNNRAGVSTSVSVHELTMPILSNAGRVPLNEWDAVIKRDKTRPQKFSIEMSHDPSVYNDRYFVTFGTDDVDSGISHFVVTEGDLPQVKSSSPYVLQNQDPKAHISVSAYDNAGNVRTAVLNERKGINWGVVTVCTLLLLGFRYFRYIKKRNG